MTIDDCNEAIKKCEWKQSLGRKNRKNGKTLYFCRGMVNMCDRVIDNGNCPTLKEMFKRESLE